jgi:hypothetical protein
MEKRSGKEWLRLILGMLSMALILMVTVAVSPPVGSRFVQTLGSAVERLRDAPGIRDRWGVTRPGIRFSDAFAATSESPALRAEEKQEMAAGGRGEVEKRVEAPDSPEQNIGAAPFAEERLAYRPTRAGGMATIQNPAGVPYSDKAHALARK